MRRISQALTATMLATALTISSPALSPAQAAPVIQSVELKADNDASSDGSSDAGAIIGGVLFALVIVDITLSGLASQTCSPGNPDAQCGTTSLTSSFIGSSLLGGYNLVSGLARMANDSLAASSSRLGLGAR